MPQIIACPFCQQQFTISEDQYAGYVGSQVTCSSCQRTFNVVQEGTTLKAVAPASGPPPIAMAYTAPMSAKTGQTNGLAIAGLICSIAGFFTCGLGSIAGIICSILGLRKSNKTGTGRGMAIAGIIIGGIWLLLVPSILLPSLARAREKANQIKCAHNLRSIGQSAMLYAQDNLRLGGPYGPGFDRLVQTQAISTQVFQCPSDSSAGTGQLTGGPCSYIWLGQNLKMSSNPQCVLAYEPLSNHGREGSNLLFADGHVEFIGKRDAAAMIKQLEQGTNPPKLNGLPSEPEQ